MKRHWMDGRHAYEIYKILHDLDYYLLRYGIEDVGKYTQDGGVVSMYYGVLTVYGATPFVDTHKEEANSDGSVSIDNSWRCICEIKLLVEAA